MSRPILYLALAMLLAAGCGPSPFEGSWTFDRGELTLIDGTTQPLYEDRYWFQSAYTEGGQTYAIISRETWFLKLEAGNNVLITHAYTDRERANGDLAIDSLYMDYDVELARDGRDTVVLSVPLFTWAPLTCTLDASAILWCDGSREDGAVGTFGAQRR